jgi:hypothetical protein
MFDVMRALGYAPPDSGEFRREPLSETATMNLRWDLYFFHHLIDVPLPNMSDPAYDRVAGTDMAFHIEDESIRRQLTTHLQTTAGRALLNLMG